MAQTTEMNVRISGMHCASCVSQLESGLSQLDGVSRSRVNLATHSGTIWFDRGQTNEASILSRIEEIGFKAEPGDPDIFEANVREEEKARDLFVASLVGAAPLMVLSMGTMLAGRALFSPLVDSLLQALLALLILVRAGRGIIEDAYRQTIRAHANMNSLIAIGTLAAFGWSLYAFVSAPNSATHELYFESAGMIISLILLGRWLEARARRKAGSAIQGLMEMQPPRATAVINGVELEIESSAIRPGMLLRVKPGERIAADGKITEGSPVIDESLLTGESVPVDKKPGHKVVGGSLNGNVPFMMEVTAGGADSFLSSMVRLVSQAQSEKAPVQGLADKVAGIFVPIVIGIAAVTGIVWYLYDPHSPMVFRAVVSVLIVACPCALGLATPTAVLAGTGRGAKDNLIIKGGDVLEQLTKLNALIFDKTGTLTHGKPEVVAVKSFGEISEQSLIRIVGSIEAMSEHPIGQSITRYMEERNIQPTVVRKVSSHPGSGITAECDGRKIVVGNRALMEEQETSLGASLPYGEKEAERGRTVVYVAMDDRVIGVLSLADKIRSEAADTIKALRNRFQRVAMISGDNRRTAAGVASTLGVEHFEAEIKPEQKQVIVDSYRRAGYRVAMVGDGVNDAPALAGADVGIAVGSGTDVALEAADVVLVRSDLSDLVRLFNLADQTLATIKQNLFWAFFYNVIAIPVAAGLFIPWLGISLTPTLAAFAMSLSSVFVVTNSLRLGRIDL